MWLDNRQMQSAWFIRKNTVLGHEHVFLVDDQKSFAMLVKLTEKVQTAHFTISMRIAVL